MKVSWSDEAPASAGVSWLVPDVIPRRGIGFLVGPSGSGKSFLGVHLGACLATGSAFFGARPTPGGGPLYVVAEGEDGFAARAAAALGGAAPRAMIASPRGVDLGTRADREKLFETVRLKRTEARTEAPRLVLLDTFSRVFRLDDENSSRDAQRATDAMHHLSEQFGAFVLAIHHPGKDRRAGMRGSSLLRAEADTVLEVRPKGIVYLGKSRESQDGYAIGRFELEETNSGGGGRATCCVRETGGRGADLTGNSGIGRVSSGAHKLKTEVLPVLKSFGYDGFEGADFKIVERQFRRSYDGSAEACRKALSRALKETGLTVKTKDGAKQIARADGRTGQCGQ